MMYTMPKNLLSICVNFTLATQRPPPLSAVITAVRLRGRALRMRLSG